MKKIASLGGVADRATYDAIFEATMADWVGA